MTIHNLTELFKLVAAVLASVGGLGAVLYFILQRVLEAHFASRLEQTKHELQLEQQRMSIVYEHQKDSFTKVLSAMHAASKAIEEKIEGIGGEWGAISSKEYDKFRRAVSPERLFLDSRADEVLDLFAESMWGAVEDGNFDAHADSDDVRRAFEEMNLIADRVAQHFRMRVGLIPAGFDPLFDIEVLYACKLVNSWGRGEYELFRPTGKTPALLVATAKENLESLKIALAGVRVRLMSDPERANFHFGTISRLDRYAASLSHVKTGKLSAKIS